MKDNKVALITGIKGQDGSYLADYLLSKGYDIFGMARRTTNTIMPNIQHLIDNKHFEIIQGDLTDQNSIVRAIRISSPDEIYHLGAMSHVGVSFNSPQATSNTNALGTLRILQAIRQINSKIKMYNASSCLPAGTKIITRKISNWIKCGKEYKYYTSTTKNIQNIEKGDFVLSMDIDTLREEYCKVINIGNRYSFDMYQISLSNGNFLQLSDNHPIFVMNKKQYIRAENIELGDFVIQKNQGSFNGLYTSINGKMAQTPNLDINIVSVTNIEKIPSSKVYDIQVQKNHNFFAKGVLVHNSEMFGKMVQNPANENTPFYPRSPYGVSKVFAHYMCKNYRQSYNMFVCNGILFNHESFRRGKQFVTRKITNGIKNIIDGKKDYIELGNLDAKRDWGYSPSFCKAMYLMLQQDIPDDYVVATGQCHSIRQFLNLAFKYVNIHDWQKYVHINPKYFRPAEVDVLVGNASKIKSIGWNYKMTFEELVNNMMKYQLQGHDDRLQVV